MGRFQFGMLPYSYDIQPHQVSELGFADRLSCQRSVHDRELSDHQVPEPPDDMRLGVTSVHPVWQAASPSCFRRGRTWFAPANAIRSTASSEDAMAAMGVSGSHGPNGQDDIRVGDIIQVRHEEPGFDPTRAPLGRFPVRPDLPTEDLAVPGRIRRAADSGFWIQEDVGNLVDLQLFDEARCDGIIAADDHVACRVPQAPAAGPGGGVVPPATARRNSG
jgi:hypothetical protein